jgi:hypothetical protein
MFSSFADKRRDIVFSCRLSRGARKSPQDQSLG